MYDDLELLPPIVQRPREQATDTPQALGSTNAAAPATRSPACPLGAATLLDVLEQLDAGVLVCAENCQLVVANDAGRRELMRRRPLDVDVSGSLSVSGEIPSKTMSFRSAVRAAAQCGRRQLLELRDGSERLMVAITPLGCHTSLALVLLGRRLTAAELALEMFGTLFALTQSERLVLIALLGGERIDSVAKNRGVTIATVRTQVSSLRAKLGVRRIDDVIRLVAGLPPMCGALRSPRFTAGATWDGAPGLRLEGQPDCPMG